MTEKTSSSRSIVLRTVAFVSLVTLSVVALHSVTCKNNELSITTPVNNDNVWTLNHPEIQVTNEPVTLNERSEKKKSLLDQTYIQFLLAIAGLIVLNMLAICVQHIYTKLTFSATSYRSLENVLSPF